MPKKGIRVIIRGGMRPTVSVEAMTRIVIALGRELAVRERDQADHAMTGSEVTVL
jgi:hypothetical protein